MNKYKIVVTVALLYLFTVVFTSVNANTAVELIDERGAGGYFYEVYKYDEPDGNRYFIWNIGSPESEIITEITEETDVPSHILHGFREAVIQVQRSIFPLMLQSAYLFLALLVFGVYARKRPNQSPLFLLPLILIIMAPLVIQSITGFLNALSDANYYSQYIWSHVGV